MPTWDEVEQLLAKVPHNQDIVVERDGVPHPLDAGFARATGLPKRGSFKHFRRPYGARGCLHVRESPTHYEVHIDTWDPRRHPLGHWWFDVKGGKATLPLSFAVVTAAVVWLVLSS